MVIIIPLRHAHTHAYTLHMRTCYVVYVRKRGNDSPTISSQPAADVSRLLKTAVYLTLLADEVTSSYGAFFIYYILI